MQKLVTILKSIFFVTDKIISSTFYAGLILIITIFVCLGFSALSEAYNAQFIWELSIFAFTFFSLFNFFLKDRKYSFNEYVILLLPISAILLIISIGLIYMSTKNNDIHYDQAGAIALYSGMILLSFALSHTTILLCRNQVSIKHN